jgi:hypothetical protein
MPRTQRKFDQTKEIHHRLDRGENVGVLLEEVGKLHEQTSTLARRAPLAPNRVVRAFCRVHGAVDIFCLSRRDPRNHLVGRRRTHFDRLAVRGRRVLVVDEEADRELCLGDDVPARERELCDEVVLLAGGRSACWPAKRKM